MENSDETTQTTDAGTETTEGPGLSEGMEAVRKAAMAGIGVVAVASGAIDSAFEQLVKRGEETREEAMAEFRRVRDRSSEGKSSASGYVRARVDGLFNALNLPSKGDVDAINAKLNILTRKVDESQAGRVDAATGAHRAGGEAPTGSPPS